MDKRNFPKVGHYDTCTFHFFLVFWDTLGSIWQHIGLVVRVKLMGKHLGK